MWLCSLDIGYLGETTSKFLKDGDGISTYNYKDFPTSEYFFSKTFWIIQ